MYAFSTIYTFSWVVQYPSPPGSKSRLYHKGPKWALLNTVPGTTFPAVHQARFLHEDMAKYNQYYKTKNVTSY